MKYIGFDREDEAEKWAREKLDLHIVPGFFRAVAAVDKNDQFMCVVVMTNFSSLNVDLTIAMDGKKMRPKETVKMFNEIFQFLFQKLRVARVTGLIRGRNYDGKRIAEHFGFKLEGVMRKSFGDDDLHVYGFLAEEYHVHSWYRG